LVQQLPSKDTASFLTDEDHEREISRWPEGLDLDDSRSSGGMCGYRRDFLWVLARYFPHTATSGPPERHETDVAER
jgi:hypothetical protein